jgi:hypothetical protein
MALLSECIGAKGFESDTYFEGALREVPLVPILEGSRHINHNEVAQFFVRYFARREASPPEPPPGCPPSLAAVNPAATGGSAYLMELAVGEGRSVRFPHFLKAYRPLRKVRNVQIIVRQLRAFRRFAVASAAAAPERDVELNIALGKCLSVIVYAQLLAEHCALADVATEMVSVLFHQSVEALTVEALRLASLPKTSSHLRTLLAGVMAVPETDQSEIDFVANLACGAWRGTAAPGSMRTEC